MTVFTSVKDLFSPSSFWIPLSPLRTTLDLVVKSYRLCVHFGTLTRAYNTFWISLIELNCDTVLFHIYGVYIYFVTGADFNQTSSWCFQSETLIIKYICFKLYMLVCWMETGALIWWLRHKPFEISWHPIFDLMFILKVCVITGI